MVYKTPKRFYRNFFKYLLTEKTVSDKEVEIMRTKIGSVSFEVEKV